MPVYTPSCFEHASTLSHFEDMCYQSYSNDAYFVMSNAVSPGTAKRYLQPEERLVLCDLGYSVEPTYTTVATYGTGFNYSTTACSGSTVYGINDGIVNSIYTYTSTGAIVSIPTINVVSNDSPNITPICIESVYANAGTILATSPNILFQPATNYVGPFLIRYIPKDNLNKTGNITYIFGYVYPSTIICNPTSVCDLVQNGGFEMGTGCGYIKDPSTTVPTFNPATLNCVKSWAATPDVFVKGCTSLIPPYNLNANASSSTYSSIPTFSPHTPGSNSAFVGLAGYINTSGPQNYHEVIYSVLSSQMIPGNVYKLGFWAYQFNGTYVDAAGSSASAIQSNTALINVPITIASSSTWGNWLPSMGSFPTPTVFTQFTFTKTVNLTPPFNTWKYYTQTFTFTPTNNQAASYFYLGIDGAQMGANYLSAKGSYSNASPQYQYYTLIDDISIKPINLAPVLALPASSVCSTQTFTDLMQYASPPGGTFTSNCGSCISQPSVGVFNFTAPSTNSLYTIVYTYTDQSNCTQQAFAQITVTNTSNFINITQSSNLSCSANQMTLTALGGSGSYTWTPGGITNPLIINPVGPSTISVSSNLSGCIATNTVAVNVLTLPPTLSISATNYSVCSGNTTTLNAIGNYNGLVWSPGNFTTNSISVSPVVNTVYSVVATNSLSCSKTETLQITVLVKPIVNIIATSSSLCPNQSATLTASGTANTYTWQPSNITATLVTVSPTIATTYTLYGTSLNGCVNQTTISIDKYNFSPTLNLIANPNPVCPGSTINLTASGSPISYTWQPGNVVGSSVIVGILSSTIYTVTGTNTTNCIASGTIAVNTLTAPPFFTLTPTPSVVCTQSPYNNTTTITVTGASNYTWIPQNIVNVPITTTNSGVFNISVTYTNGCNYPGNVTVFSTTVIASTTPTMLCTNSPTLDLYSLTNFTSGCTFSVNGAPTTNVFPSNSPIGTFTVNLTYTNSVLCSNSASTTIIVQAAPVTPTIAYSNSVACTGTGFSITALPLTQTYTWLPYNFVGNPLVVTSPTAVVSITAVAGPNQCSLAAIPIDLPFLDVPCVCLTGCSSTIGGLASTTLSGQSYCAPGNVSISGVVTFSNCEFRMAPNSSITIGAGSSLIIEGSHLYACENMWQGIVVLDGGKLIMRASAINGNLIEDAITAIDVSNHITSTLTAFGAILDISNTIFNKNYISINLNNYSRNFTPYPFAIHSNVFTSRTLTFTPISWPTCSVSGTGMRAASNPTAGLQVPYLLNGNTFTITNLKSPNNTQPSHIGIKLNGVGSSTGTVQYAIQIGRTSNANDFNVFDAHGQCIESTNSNVFSVNNVFQNTQQYTFDPPGPNPPYTFGGNGIRHVTNNFSFNSKLDLWSTSTNMSLGNRFYDCQYAVNCDKTFLLNVRYCTFRSAKTTSATATGSVGVISRTNRFNHTISNNNIANIHTPINIALAPDTYTYNGNSGYGINAQNLAIQSNFIGAQTTTATAISNQFVNQAITLSAPTGSVYQVTLNSFAVTTNTIDRVFRGIEINNFGKNNFTANTSTNTIKLGDDNVFALPQYGIRYLDNYKGTIRSNTLSATGITNTLITLFYAGNSVANPTVICNNLKSSYQAFEFNSNNSNVYWRGNFMDTHQRGLVLSNNGIIGTQGSSGNPIDNQYTGSWTGRNCTWTSDASTSASNSPMWIKNIGILPYAPINNNGTPFGQSYGAGWINNTTGTFTGCGGSGGGGGGGAAAATMLSSSTIQSNTLTNEVKYIQDFGNYQTMKSDLNYTLNNTSNQTFVNSLNGSSIDKFIKVDGLYYSGNLVTAKSLNSSISCTNNIESLYKSYYNLYDKYITNSFTSVDNNALSYIAELCPGTNGTAVYKARALYNYINQTARVYNDNCGKVSSAARENNDIVSEISSINKL